METKVVNAKIKTLVDSFVGGAGDLGASLGLNRSIVQLYALLYLSPDALSLDEMSERLKISKGNVSMNIRVLEGWEAVRPVWIKGSRKDYYEANVDIIGVVLNRLKAGLTTRLNKSENMLKQAEARLKDTHSLSLSLTDKKAIEVYQKRLNEVKNISVRLATLVNTFSPALVKRFL
ncbi:MAG: hypothetical protein AAB019_06350 [Planctomycetota bacterium]